MLRILEARSEGEIAETRKLFHEYQEALSVDLEFQGFAAEVAALPDAYAPPRGRLLIAWEGDSAVGCVALRPLAGAICEMKRLYVRPHARRSGVGRLLAERVIAEARAIGYEQVALDTLPRMEGAQRLYQQLGFHDIPAYFHNPVAGARYMALDLDIAGPQENHMESYKILFDQIDWQSPQPGVRFKVARDATRQLRLVEFTPEFVEHEWCERGHAGLVLSGELEIDFSGHVVRFSEGSALLIPAGKRHAHKARMLTPLVRLFLVEDPPPNQA